MTAFTSSIQAIDVIVRDQHAKAIAERAVVEPDGRGGWIASEPDDDPEFGTIGCGASREAAIADLIEASDIDTSPDPTPEQLAAWRAAEDAPERGGEDEWDHQLTGREQDCFTGIDEEAE